MNLNTFFKEKDIPFQAWEIESNGQTHMIDNEVVIEAVKATTGSEREQVKNTLIKIDFHNGDVNHFLKHLAHGLVANY